MSHGSKIEWTEATWNPCTGCDKVSAGCEYCYAERMARRLQAMHQPNYINGFNLTIHEHMLEVPLKWKHSKTVFVNSMSDLFHPKVPLNFIIKVFEIMGQAYWHRFQVLTKRSKRLIAIQEHLTWYPNIWMGITVENNSYSFRIDDLRKCPAKIKFLSFEPLLGPIDTVNLQGIDWVIVGGESGPKARPIKLEWIRDIRELCLQNYVPFFFKQWGGKNKKKSGRQLDGRYWNEMPSLNTDYKMAQQGA